MILVFFLVKKKLFDWLKNIQKWNDLVNDWNDFQKRNADEKIDILYNRKKKKSQKKNWMQKKKMQGVHAKKDRSFPSPKKLLRISTCDEKKT